MKKSINYLFVVSVLCMVACTPSLPEKYTTIDKLPSVYPDYTNVTIPCNIAPLTFKIDNTADKFVTRLSCNDVQVVLAGANVRPSQKEWEKLLSVATGKEINVEVYACEGDKWNAYKSFSYYVSPDTIDQYISYRLIQPSYVCYEMLSINQRNLSNYDEDVIYTNILASSEDKGQCINCHAYKNYRTDNMQFHMRQQNGGTLFVHNGNAFKLNMNTDSTLSAGVYPAFNPVYDVVAYSVNKTGQIFHTKHPNKVEVQDLYSDIILYNPVANVVTNVVNDNEDLEVFPWWSPDGRTLYYGSAHFEVLDTANERMKEEVLRYREIKYDILRRSWNPETFVFGEADTVFAATKLGKSATFPRVSPDGRYLLFALGEYGCFHVWHHDADLYLQDLQTGKYWPLTEANSPHAESYHSWSSNSRWILFSSRRDDTNYTRLYIAHISPDGKPSKAFVLPQKSPNFYPLFDRSYNVPEFMVEPVRFTPHCFAEIARGEETSVKYSVDGM